MSQLNAWNAVEMRQLLDKVVTQIVKVKVTLEDAQCTAINARLTLMDDNAPIRSLSLHEAWSVIHKLLGDALVDLETLLAERAVDQSRSKTISIH